MKILYKGQGVSETNGLLQVIAISILLIAIGLLTLFIDLNNSDNQEILITSSDKDIINRKYKDGEYTYTAEYGATDVIESFTITLSLSDGFINEFEFIDQANLGKSKKYNSEFKTAISEKILGKKINSIEIEKIAGASLTTNAFNSAINEIRLEAAI
ncbi:MAG: FMN-binding protein [Candidatus Dojkabacteria bacterium]|nr:FMN-binding protein [Candidatus Dojkabacteria bacterium]MDQ7020815.1 FMN-binding protein [Candidatus Dojkabacteria bacterium]